MPINIEIKARLRDRSRVEARAAAMADGPARILRQEDTFFRGRKGRLKLRVESGGPGQLIYYERSDGRAPKPSTYHITRIDDPGPLSISLEHALGIRGRVIKERTLFLVGRTRIHLDRVTGLGDFMELEVVLEEGQSREEGAGEAEALMRELGIPEEDRVEGAYMDLLESLNHDALNKD